MSSKDPALQAYLASKYLSGAKADAILARHAGDSIDGQKLRKKKKRKVDDSGAGGMRVGSGSGLMIADDDGGWAQARDDEAEDDVPGEHTHAALQYLASPCRLRADEVGPGSCD